VFDIWESEIQIRNLNLFESLNLEIENKNEKKVKTRLGPRIPFLAHFTRCRPNLPGHASTSTGRTHGSFVSCASKPTNKWVIPISLFVWSRSPPCGTQSPASPGNASFRSHWHVGSGCREHLPRNNLRQNLCGRRNHWPRSPPRTCS
jgi:hypothetical protein